MPCKKSYSRLAIIALAGWSAAGALATTSHSSGSSGYDESDTTDVTYTQDEALGTSTSSAPNTPEPDSSYIPGTPDKEHAEEAQRAYDQAIAALASMTTAPASSAPAFFSTSSKSSSSTFMDVLSHYMQTPGPLGSALRIITKLRGQANRVISAPPFSYILSASSGDSTVSKRDEERALMTIDLLQHAADLGNMDALLLLGRIYMLPPTPAFSLNLTGAFSAFTEHAQTTGDALSQSFMGFFYSTGYGGVAPVDQAKAQLYYTFAAENGDRGAQMALAYRYWAGIGTLDVCSRSMVFYERAAEQAMMTFLAGPPGGRTLPLTITRLSDLEGGAYGPGASVASTGANHRRPAVQAGLARSVGETWEDVLDYYEYNADRGEMDFAYKLGKIYYQGSLYPSAGGIASGAEGVGRVPRNFAEARRYLLRVARAMWPHDPPNPLDYRSSPPPQDRSERQKASWAAPAAGLIGRMYLRGEGFKQDPAAAKMWFERGAEFGDREAHNGLGIIWRDGLIRDKVDLQKAFNYFQEAANAELAEAQVNLGKIFFEQEQYDKATKLFEVAMRNGSPFEAHYYLGIMQAAQANNVALPDYIRQGACATAVSLLKNVAERGSWLDNFVQEAEEAWASGTEHGKDLALIKWAIAAEQGHESAQNNLAFVLDQDKSFLTLPHSSPHMTVNDTARIALTQWSRSAAQRNIDALVKVGDYYYHGLGVPDEPENIRWEKAAQYYRSAADTQQSALAMWNLGWMYENGVGVPRDFHLAKRHYDMALEINSEAYLPVTLSLIKLHLRSLWHSFRGGEGGLSLFGDDTSRWEEIEGAHYEDETSDSAVYTQESRGDRVEDGAWYLGKAREEFQNRQRNREWQNAQADGADDHVQWARDRRVAESEMEGDFGPEDYFDDATRGRRRDVDEEDEFTETVLLVALVLAVTVLLYVRTRIIDRLRRGAMGEEEQRQQDRGDANWFN